MEFEIDEELLEYIESCGCNPEEMNPRFMEVACRECMNGTLKPAFEDEEEYYEF